MIPCLQEINPVISHQIDDAMFLRQPSGPGSRCEVAQRFRLADALEGITKNGLDQVKSAQGQLAVGLYPVT